MGTDSKSDQNGRQQETQVKARFWRCNLQRVGSGVLPDVRPCVEGGRETRAQSPGRPVEIARSSWAGWVVRRDRPGVRNGSRGVPVDVTEERIGVYNCRASLAKHKRYAVIPSREASRRGADPYNAEILGSGFFEQDWR